MSDFKVMYHDRSYDGLYHSLLHVAKAEPGGDVIALDVDSLKGEAFRLQWNEWVRSNPSKILTTDPPAASSAPAQPVDDGLARLQKERREAEEATAKTIEAAANARASWYVSDQGMLDNDYNRDLFLGWFEANKAAYTAHHVDLAVESLASQIQWAVWSPRVQPVNEIRLIEGTNEPELPIDATESQMRKASRVQLTDLSKRRGEFTQNRRGSFGSVFIEPTF
jgi:hypothetical protein